MVHIDQGRVHHHHAPAAVPAGVVDLREEAFTPRQQQVLQAALELLVEGGAGLTMTAVARRASCSKETLYKWFGDRDGLLTATVQWQAAKVRVPRVDRHRLDATTLRESIVQFARDLLGTLAGEISVTLNRLAVSHTGGEKPDIGKIVLENGRLEMGRRLKPVLEAGRDARLLRIDSSEEAFRTFFGLVVRDVQIRLLLGDELKLSPAQIDADAKRATEQFLALYERK
jgi:AcrR family transcriptional regulator